MVELVEAVAMLAVTVGAVLAMLSMGVAPGAEIPPEPPEPTEPALLPNTVNAGGRRYLRAVAGCGAVLHLVPHADGPLDARSALGADAGEDVPGMPGYDDELMHLPVWNLRTMCGLRWIAMAGHDAELAALIARAGAPAQPADGGASYVCSVCAARVVPDWPAARERG